jgi:hypothetical protein
MIERAVLDVEAARDGAFSSAPTTRSFPPEARDGEKPDDSVRLDSYARRWLEASPAKARAALEASLATADARFGGSKSKAGALVAAARADTTKTRAKLRESILEAFGGREER